MKTSFATGRRWTCGSFQSHAANDRLVPEVELPGTLKFLTKTKAKGSKQKRVASSKTRNVVFGLQRASVKRISDVGGETGRGYTKSCLGPDVRKLRAGLGNNLYVCVRPSKADNKRLIARKRKTVR